MRIEPATVTLREIDDANRAAVEALRVAPGQEQYVAGVAQSFVDAETDAGACPWYRAVYSGDEPVGFVMISDNVPADRTEYLGPYYLWRLMVDARWQGEGDRVRGPGPGRRLPALPSGRSLALHVRGCGAGVAEGVLPAVRLRRDRAGLR